MEAVDIQILRPIQCELVALFARTKTPETHAEKLPSTALEHTSVEVSLWT